MTGSSNEASQCKQRLRSACNSGWCVKAYLQAAHLALVAVGCRVCWCLTCSVLPQACLWHCLGQVVCTHGLCMDSCIVQGQQALLISSSDVNARGLQQDIDAALKPICGCKVQEPAACRVSMVDSVKIRPCKTGKVATLVASAHERLLTDIHLDTLPIELVGRREAFLRDT